MFQRYIIMMQKFNFNLKYKYYKYIGVCFFVLIMLLIRSIYADKEIAVKPLSKVEIFPVKAQTLPALNISDKELAQLINETDTSKVSPPKENHQDIFITPQSSNELATSSLHVATQSAQTNDTTSQRCMYNSQPYVLGDMVKTDSGWIRCTSTVFFADNNPTTAQPGEAVWTKVQ